MNHLLAYAVIWFLFAVVFGFGLAYRIREMRRLRAAREELRRHALALEKLWKDSGRLN